MKRYFAASLAALLLALAAGSADARKPSRGGSSVSTNYGCSTLAAGTVLRSADNLTQKRLLMATYACYLCNLSTNVCTVQSPASIAGWTFLH